MGFYVFVVAVLAIIALVVALQASNEVTRLKYELQKLRDGDVAPVPMPAPPPPQPSPSPPPAAPPAPPPAAAPPPPPPPRPSPVVPRPSPIDWENIIGIRLFSWIAGIALVLAAVFLFKYSVEHGWLRPAIRAGFGLAGGVALLIVCELRIARDYKFTANAMLGAGIAILYATLFAMHARWELVPAAVSFGGMLLVTAAAVFLSTRRDSVFVALLGLLGGFATPALLSSGENRPIALFSYLLLLNGGLSWVAYRKRWPALTVLSIFLTALYQWSWIAEYLDRGQLPLAASVFVVFAIIAATALWARRGERPFESAALFGAMLPLLFAFFTAIVPEYGARFNVLFGFLLLVTSGLAAIALLRDSRWLHTIGGAATVLTFLLWLVVSYTHQSWPWSLVWLGAFVALYLAVGVRIPSFTPGVLFFVFIGLATHEPERYVTLIGAMFALLTIVAVYAIRFRRPTVLALATAFSSIALMALGNAPLPIIVAGQAVLLIVMLAIAWTTGKHWIGIATVTFAVLATFASPADAPEETLVTAFVFYAIVMTFAILKTSIASTLAASAISIAFFFFAWPALDKLGFDDVIGLLPLFVAAVMVLLITRVLRAEAQISGHVALVAGVALAFITAAVPLQLEKEWVTIAWALEAAALTWLFTKVPQRGLVYWSTALLLAVLARLVFNPAAFAYHAKSDTPIFNWYLYTYVACAAAAFVAAYFAPDDDRAAYSGIGVLLLFVLLNIEIADFCSTGQALTFNFFSSPLAQELTYTIGWALFAIAMLVAGIILGKRGARVAALGLLFVTILKCFLHDLARLGGLYRVGSLFGLAVSLVLVGILLQKFVVMRREEPSTAP